MWRWVKTGSFDYVLPLTIKYTVVIKWRSADGVAGLCGLTVKAHCLREYSHYPLSQPPAQLSLHYLMVNLENGIGAGGRNYYWRDIPTYSCSEKSSLVLSVMVSRSKACLRCYGC